MLPKRWAMGLGVIAVSLAALFGFACDDDDDNGNGTEPPAATEPADNGDDAEPTETPTE